MTDEQTVRLKVDHAADAVYLKLTDRPIKDSEEVADGIVVDYYDEGRIVGIEILDARRPNRTRSGQLRRVVAWRRALATSGE
jgi:uncharacterized protein YuzE